MICMDLVVILLAALLMPSILSLANQWNNRLSALYCVAHYQAELVCFN